MRLANGTLFLMLITLFVPDPRGVRSGNCGVPRNDVLVVMLTEEIFLWSL